MCLISAYESSRANPIDTIFERDGIASNEEDRVSSPESKSGPLTGTTAPLVVSCVQLLLYLPPDLLFISPQSAIPIVSKFIN